MCEKYFKGDHKKQREFWMRHLTFLSMPRIRNINEILKQNNRKEDRVYFSYMTAVDFASAWEKFVKKSLISIGENPPKNISGMYDLFENKFAKYKNSDLKRVIDLIKVISNSKKHDIQFENDNVFLNNILDTFKEAQGIVFDTSESHHLKWYLENWNELDERDKNYYYETKKELEIERERIIEENDIQYVVDWIVVMFRSLFEEMVSTDQRFRVTYLDKKFLNNVRIMSYVWGENSIEEMKNDKTISIINIEK